MELMGFSGTSGQADFFPSAAFPAQNCADTERGDFKDDCRPEHGHCVMEV